MSGIYHFGSVLGIVQTSMIVIKLVMIESSQFEFERLFLQYLKLSFSNKRSGNQLFALGFFDRGILVFVFSPHLILGPFYDSWVRISV